MSQYRQELKGRFAVLGIVIVAVLAGLLVRLWTMQVLNADEFQAMAESNRVRQISLEAPRGRIYDRNGVELVTNRSALAVSIDPTHEDVRVLLIRATNGEDGDDPTRTELEDLFGELAGMLGMTPTEIFEHVTDLKQEALRPRVVAVDTPIEIVAQLLERQTDFPWVRVEEIAVREYPNGPIAAHVVGYTGAISEEQFASSDVYAGYELGDIVGKTGAERQFECSRATRAGGGSK